MHTGDVPAWKRTLTETIAHRHIGPGRRGVKVCYHYASRKYLVYDIAENGVAFLQEDHPSLHEAAEDYRNRTAKATEAVWSQVLEQFTE